MITAKQTKHEISTTNGIEFLASGTEKMRQHARLLEEHRRTNTNLILQLTGTLCVGQANLAQGVELILKGALGANQITDAGLKQHELFSRFELFSSHYGGFEDLRDQEANRDWVKETLIALENQFMPARYFGQRGRESIDTVRPDIVLRIALWVVWKVSPHQMSYARDRLGLPVATKKE